MSESYSIIVDVEAGSVEEDVTISVNFAVILILT